MMIIELQEEKWVYFVGDTHGMGKEDRCEYCRKMAILNFPCKCKEIDYCS